MDFFEVEDFNLSKFKSKKWSFDSEKDADIITHLDVLFEGTVFGVEKNFIMPYLNQEEVSDIRMGRKKMPRFYELKDRDDFLKILAMHIPISEYSK